MNAPEKHRDLPDNETIELARESASELGRLLAKRPRADRARVQMDSADLVLPRQALELLRGLLAEMAQGNAVTILPRHAEITTQEAADMLNVSRPHLIKLLDQGAIPYTRTGTHRRIRLQNLMAYKDDRDRQSREAMDALVEEAQKHQMGY